MKKINVNRVYKIVGYEECKNERVLQRLLEFGFTIGEKFVVSYKSLLGQSVIVELRGYSLSMRTKFLSILKVQE